MQGEAGVRGEEPVVPRSARVAVLASPFGLPPEHPSFPNTSLRNKPTFEIPCQVGRRQDKNAYCERKSAYGDISTLFLYMHILDHSATRVILHMSQRHDKIAAGKPKKKK
jgi:hypothetical protein